MLSACIKTARWRTSLAALALGLVLTAPAGALPGDRDQPVRIQADRAERNEKTGVTTYEGHVVIDQGSLHLTAHKVHLYSDNGEVTRMEAFGQPAYLQQRPSRDKGLVHARGATIRYFVEDAHVQLEGEASLEQAGSTVHSDRIDYFIDDELVRAENDDTTGRQRVEVVLPPKTADDE